MAFIVAEPAATAVTSPDELTEAIDGAVEDHVIFLLVALVGEIVAVNCSVCPTMRLEIDLFRETPVTSTFGIYLYSASLTWLVVYVANLGAPELY